MSESDPYVLAAFLDVLGYRDRLAKDRDSGRLDFKDALQKAMQVFSQVNEAFYAYQAISDTILVTSTDDSDLAGLLNVLKNVQLAFLREGLLIRGGLAYERHFKSNNITYSHALALAYHIESDIAVYPRIVIDSNLIETQKTKNLWPVVAKSQLVCECNGLHFANILDKDNWTQVYEWSKAIYQSDREALTGREKEFLKHAWLEHYLFSSPHAKPDQKHGRYMPPISVMG